MNVHEEILKVAHDLYERSGRVEGRDHENWHKAERIVMEGRMNLSVNKDSSNALDNAGMRKKAKQPPVKKSAVKK
jgi:hypothetical protein